jgi:hypothetical protein
MQNGVIGLASSISEGRFNVLSFEIRNKIHWRAIQDRREAVSQEVGRAIKELRWADCALAGTARR